MKLIYIDLMPMRLDGHNGGNSIFIIKLLEKLAKNKNYSFLFSVSSKKVRKTISRLGFNNISFLEHLEHLERLKHLENGIFFQIVIFLKKTHIFFEKKNRTLIVKVFLRLNYYLIKLIEKFLAKKKSLFPDIEIAFSPYGHFSEIVSLPSVKRKVSIIYDLQHKEFPNFFDSKELIIRELHYKESISSSNIILTISHFTKNKIIEIYKTPPSKIHVIYLPIVHPADNKIKNLLIHKKSTLNLHKFGRFFYIPANFWEHKNHQTLFIAINMLIASGIDINFVFSGAFPSKEIEEKFRLFIDTNNLNKNIFLLGYLESHNIVKLFKNCISVICPSLYEGFGMTLNEANFYRKPCFASNIPAHREIASSECVIFFDPYKPEDIFKKMKIFLTKKNKFKYSSFLNNESLYDDYINLILGT